MYMCVRPESRSATYQATNAAGIQRQSGIPANQRLSARDRTNRVVTHEGAAFIILIQRPKLLASPAFARKILFLKPRPRRTTTYCDKEGCDFVMLPEGPMIEAHRVTLSRPDDFDGWRQAARDLAEAGVPESAVLWQVESLETDLFGTEN